MNSLWKIGYGFVDFESPVAAENAVKNLQAQGVQAQMAKVNVKCHLFFNYYFIQTFIYHLVLILSIHF